MLPLKIKNGELRGFTHCVDGQTFIHAYIQMVMLTTKKKKKGFVHYHNIRTNMTNLEFELIRVKIKKLVKQV